MLALIPGTSQDPLFSVPKKGKNVALTYEQLRRLLSKWIAMTGTDPTGYSPHSLHWGAQAKPYRPV